MSDSERSEDGADATEEMVALSKLKFPSLPDMVGFQQRYNELAEDKNDVNWISIVKTYEDSQTSFDTLKDGVDKILTFFDIRPGRLQTEETPNLTDMSLLNGLAKQANQSLTNLQYEISKILTDEQTRWATEVSNAMENTGIALGIEEKFKGWAYEEDKSKITTLITNFNIFNKSLQDIKAAVSRLEYKIAIRLKTKIKGFSSSLLNDQLNKAEAVTEESFKKMSGENSAELPLYRAEGLLSSINYFDEIFLPGVEYTILDVMNNMFPNQTQQGIVFVKFKREDQQGEKVVAAQQAETSSKISYTVNDKFTAPDDLNHESVISVIKDDTTYTFRNSPRYFHETEKKPIGDPARFEDYEVIPQFSNYLVSLGEEMKSLLLEAKRTADDAKKSLKEKGADNEDTRKKIDQMKAFAKKFLEEGKEGKEEESTQNSRAEGSLLLDPLSRSPPYRRLPAYGRAMQLKALATD